MTSSDPVRTVLLGNSFATRVQLPGLAWAGGAEVLGLAGHDAAKARATADQHGIPHATGNWRELLALEPELVLVSTPVDLHLPMVEAALAAGAAVLCEKPFGLHAGEARAMAAAAAGRPAWIDHELRWSPYVRALRDAVRSGAVGTPWRAVFELFGGPERGRSKPWCWWFDGQRGGGVWGALGSHMVDLLRWTLGEVVAVRASLRVLGATRPDAEGQAQPVTADELALVELEHASGVHSELRLSTVLHGEPGFRLQVDGSGGALRLCGETDLTQAQGGGPLEPVAVDAPFPTCSEMGLPEYGPFGRSFPLFARDLVAAVRDGTPLSDAATFEDGLAVQRVLDAARRSSPGPWTLDESGSSSDPPGGWVPIEGTSR